MAPISKSLSNSLDRMNAQISKAELALAKLPGAGRGSVEIETSGDGSQGTFLEFNSEKAEIVWRSYDLLHYEILAEVHILDMSAARRTELAKLVPDLLDSAFEAEAEVANEADEAAAAIETSLATKFLKY